ncbi:MAG: hypothetical protein ACXW30_06725 [Micavibrio sp.]
MSYAALKSSLVKAFTAVAVAGAVSGCATMCDKQCNLEQSARAMTGSSDVGVRAMGVRTLEDLHPEIKKEGDALRESAMPKNVECTVSAVEVVNGRKMVRLTDCASPAPAVR